MGCALLFLPGSGLAAEPPATEAEVDSSADSTRWALILTGLPGDDEHDQRFRSILKIWQNWLSEDLGFPAENVTVMYGLKPTTESNEKSATRENLQRVVNELQAKIGPRDTLWVLVLGHASYDGQRGWFHLPGPDVNDMQLADLLAGIKCREQVLWLTHTCSGWFLRALSREGRIVITATEADNEANETEFPDSLAAICQRGADAVDKDGDGRVSLAELFVAVVGDVEARFAADERAPTEHAQLDDDGDGRGTEATELTDSRPDSPPDESIPLSLRRDGAIANQTFLSWKTGGSPE